jgi:hypothetical protein
MLSNLETDRVRLPDIEAQILDMECSLSASLDRGAHLVDLERSLSVFRTEKTLVQERLHSYRYPVLELPNEIIFEIFIHFLPIYPAWPFTGLLSPTTLTHICRQWREITLTTPLLWRAIGLSDERRSDICNT